MPMMQFVAAMTVFLALHIIPSIPGIRAKLIAARGRGAYLIAYSLVSILALVWLFHAALQLDFVALWNPAPWQAWVTIILTPIGVFLLIAGLFSPNPASISLRRPDLAPGAVTTITRHPVLWGFALWSGSHLVPNGDLRSLLLFGALSTFAVLGMIVTDRRAHRRLGRQWTVIAERTSVLPFAAVLMARTPLRLDRPLVASFLITTLFTAGMLLGGHAALFGADPLTMVFM